MPTIGEKVSSPWGGTAHWLGRCRLGGNECDLVSSWYALPAAPGLYGLAVLAIHKGQPWAKISVSVPVGLDAWEFVCSHDVDAATLADLLHSGLVADTGREVSYGFVADASILRLSDAVIGGLVAVAKAAVMP